MIHASVSDEYDGPPHIVTRYIGRRMSRRSILLLAALALGCRPAAAPVPPRAEFLVAAGDSTFWVRADERGFHVRGAPLRLARFNGRFYELYTADDDRSFTDAVIVGARVYRRDLLTDDSVVVFEDTTIAGIARWYAREHPHDRPLDDDEDTPDDPSTSAYGDLDFLDQFGPYLSFEYRGDYDGGRDDAWHTARHGVIDLRTGRATTVVRLVGERAADTVLHRGAELFRAAIDSVLHSRDARAARAIEAIHDFTFEPSSFTLTSVDGAPAIAFAAVGHGARAGGLLLELPPIPVAAPSWWAGARVGLPTAESDSAGARWDHGRLALIARQAVDDSTVPDGGDRLTVRDSAGRDWPVGPIPAPATHVYWLDPASIDRTTRRALARAFDEAALYNEEVRTAMADPTTTDRLSRPVRASQHETSEIMMPQHANNLGHVFGGVILAMMDRTAAVSAIRHARGNCVTVSVDRVDFREPIHLGDLVVMKSSVNYAGRTSMEVGVRVEAENLITGERRHTNSCYLTFVAVDRDGRPVMVPSVVPETDEEKRRYAAAIERRRRRLEERAAEEA